MTQRSFAEVVGFRKQVKVTRREAFPAEMDRLVPWVRPEGRIAPYFTRRPGMGGVRIRFRR
jgi:IS5 family transposase